MEPKKISLKWNGGGRLASWISEVIRLKTIFPLICSGLFQLFWKNSELFLVPIDFLHYVRLIDSEVIQHVIGYTGGSRLIENLRLFLIK